MQSLSNTQDMYFLCVYVLHMNFLTIFCGDKMCLCAYLRHSYTSRLPCERVSTRRQQYYRTNHRTVSQLWMVTTSVQMDVSELPLGLNQLSLLFPGTTKANWHVCRHAVWCTWSLYSEIFSDMIAVSFSIHLMSEDYSACTYIALGNLKCFSLKLGMRNTFLIPNPNQTLVISLMLFWK